MDVRLSGVETCERWLSCHWQETSAAEKDDKWPVILSYLKSLMGKFMITMTLTQICYSPDSPSPLARRPRIQHGAGGDGGRGRRRLMQYMSLAEAKRRRTS